MIEMYVLLSLIGIGYILSQEEPVKAKYSKYEISPADMPTGNSAYESTFSKQVAAVEAKAAKTAYDASLRTAAAAQQGKLATSPTPRVINRSHQLYQQSNLAGVPMDFTHNNMMPFFKKQGGQTFKETSHATKLETFTGLRDLYMPKREQEPLYVPAKDMGNVFGSANQSDFVFDRIQKPKLQNNIAPIEQVRVGPGIGQGYTTKGVGGFHQFETRDYAVPKSVDDLRVATNPKMQFESRIVDGQKETQRGKVGDFAQNRAPRYYTTTEDHLFKTTGAVLKNKQRPCLDAKYTNRVDTSKPYAGVMFHKGKGEVLAGAAREPFKQQDGPLALGHASKMTEGKGVKYDYGKSNILVYANERDVTTVRTHTGNLTSLVKAIVAPIEDIFKQTRKETMVDNPRQFGELQATFPSKGTVHDPTHVTRTTIKETTLQPAEMMNLKGNTKSRVYDVTHVARTTVKETTLSAAELANLKGPIRTVIYDPTDVARTTIKETLLQESEIANFAPNERRGAVYDPEVKAKATVRQTMDAPETNVNMRPGAVKRGQAFDTSMPAKTTVKETTVDVDYTGQADRVTTQLGAYMDAFYDAPSTERELNQREHFGGIDARGAGDGYIVTEMDAKATERELMGDLDYFGHAAGGDKKQRSYDAEESVETTAEREVTLMGRVPTAQGAKQAVGVDEVPELDVRRMAQETEERFGNQDRVHQVLDTLDGVETTRQRNEYCDTDRLDLELLNAFRDNPYTQSLDSVA